MSCAVDDSCAGIAARDALHRLQRGVERQRLRRRPAATRHHLAHHGALHLDDRRQRGHAAVGRLRQARDGVVGAVDHQLAPQLAHHVGARCAPARRRWRTGRPRPAGACAGAASCAAAASSGADHQVAAAVVLHARRARASPWPRRPPPAPRSGGRGARAWRRCRRRSAGSAPARRRRAAARSARATASVSVDLTQNSTRSASRTAARSVRGGQAHRLDAAGHVQLQAVAPRSPAHAARGRSA